MGGSTQDLNGVTPLGLLFLLCMGVLTWVLPRRLVIAPLLLTTCYMPSGQSFMIGGLHFPGFRILLLLGLCRVWTRREAAGLELSKLDRVFAWWAAVTLV